MGLRKSLNESGEWLFKNNFFFQVVPPLLGLLLDNRWSVQAVWLHCTGYQKKKEILPPAQAKRTLNLIGKCDDKGFDRAEKKCWTVIQCFIHVEPCKNSAHFREFLRTIMWGFCALLFKNPAHFSEFQSKILWGFCAEIQHLSSKIFRSFFEPVCTVKWMKSSFKKYANNKKTFLSRFVICRTNISIFLWAQNELRFSIKTRP